MDSSRRLIVKAALVAALVAASPSVLAQQYPSKPVKVIVPAGAGTGIDAIARFFSDRLSKRLGQPFVPDNRGGAGGLIGYTQLTKSPPDGYTILLTGIPLYLLPLFSESSQPTYDPQKDFAPIARVARVPQAIVVAADSPYKTIADLVQAMKKEPGEITHSSQGPGSSAHMCAVVFQDLSRTKARHVPYKESSMALTDVAAGRVVFTCLSSAQVLPLIQGRKLRALGVTNATRWESLPEVPTVEEAGLPGFEVSSQLDFMAPAGTPEPILQMLSNEITQIAQSADYKDYAAKQAIAPAVMDYKALVAEVARENARWKRIAQLARE